jgi:hypothetical protein
MSAPCDSSVSELETSHKTVAIADDVEVRVAFKDFYIIRAGECDFTGQDRSSGVRM